jgi:hypothetical protein
MKGIMKNTEEIAEYPLLLPKFQQFNANLGLFKN